MTGMHAIYSPSHGLIWSLYYAVHLLLFIMIVSHQGTPQDHKPQPPLLSAEILIGAYCCRGYNETKLQENLDAEIFGVLLDEAREAFDEELVVELNSERDEDVESNCARISSWVQSWKHDRA